SRRSGRYRCLALVCILGLPYSLFLIHHRFFPLTPPPPRSPLSPYTTLFRSPCSTAVATWSRASHMTSGALELTSAARNCWVIVRSEEHTSELQSRFDLVCRLLLEKKK